MKLLFLWVVAVVVIGNINLVVVVVSVVVILVVVIVGPNLLHGGVTYFYITPLLWQQT